MDTSAVAAARSSDEGLAKGESPEGIKPTMVLAIEVLYRNFRGRKIMR